MNTTSRFDRITIDATQMNGQPCIRRTRLTVRRVLEALAAYPDREELREKHPELEVEAIRQGLLYVASLLEVPDPVASDDPPTGMLAWSKYVQHQFDQTGEHPTL